MVGIADEKSFVDSMVVEIAAGSISPIFGHSGTMFFSFYDRIYQTCHSEWILNNRCHHQAMVSYHDMIF